MTRRCFLHVGVPKTGTTYLQDILWDSRKALRSQGFRLPLDSLDDHFFLTLALRGRLDAKVDPPAALHVLERLRKDLHRSRSHDVLISHELLAPVEADRIDELMVLLQDFEVHVVVTARDLARQVPAEWQQTVKTRSTMPYEKFVARVANGRARHFWSVQDVASVAERWGRNLPPDRVHIVTVPQAGSPPELLLSRFCGAVGLRPEGLVTSRPRPNASLSYDQAELLRRVNVALGERLPSPRHGYNAVVKTWFAEKLLSGQEARRTLGLPMEQWDWAVSTAKQTAVRLEDAGFRVHGDLSDLVPTCPAAEPVECPTEADVTDAAVEVLSTILAQRPGPRRRRRRFITGRRARVPKRSAQAVNVSTEASTGRLSGRRFEVPQVAGLAPRQM